MEDGWKELERTVPGTLLIIGWISQESVRLIRAAKRKLFSRVNMLRTKNQGAMDNYVDPEPVGVHSHVLLNKAIREIKLRRARHGKVLRILPLCIENRRLDPGVRGSRWRSHHSAALQRADEALMKLRSAASFSRAAQDAIDIAATFAKRSRPWVFWMQAFYTLSCDANNEAGGAGLKVLEMRRHVRMEFLEALIILNSSTAATAEGNNQVDRQ